MSDQIQVEAVAPAMPLILADSVFLNTLADVETQVAALKITDAISAQHAANLQVRLTSAGKKLEATRVALKKPFRDIAEKIDETAREPANRIERAKSVLKSAQIAWDTEQQRLAREAEQARQRELDRLEKLRQAEEAETRRKADELAKQAAEAAAKMAAPTLDIDFDDGPAEPPPKTEVERQIEAVKYAPAPVIAKPSGVRFKTTLVPVVKDVNQLPDCFVTKTANVRGIIATFCSGWSEGDKLPVCSGVEFKVEKTVDSTGRSVF